MITLHQLTPPDNQTIFEKCPELNHIWEVPALQKEARESYESWEPLQSDGIDMGEIFSINENNNPIGIIGWFKNKNKGRFLDIVRLRYYGIIPSKRGNGYGEIALKLFLEHLSKTTTPQHLFLSEGVSLCRAIAPQIAAHFKKVGFVEFDDPDYGSNANCGEVLSLKIRIPGR